jgi:hypothetical protein
MRFLAITSSFIGLLLAPTYSQEQIRQGQVLQPVEDQGVGVMLHPQAPGERPGRFDKDIRRRLEWFAIR